MMNQRSLLVLVFCAFVGMANPAHAVFIGDNVGNLWNLDVATNTSTLIGNSGSAMVDIALDPTTNILYGVTDGGLLLVSINTSTAVATSIGVTGAGINGLTFDSSGMLFGSGGTNLFTVDLGTGAATTVGSTGFNSSGDIAFDSGGNLFLSALGGDVLVSVNSSTGAGSLIGDITFVNVFGLNFAGSTLNGFTSNGLTLEINTSTGVGTQVAINSINAFGADGVGGVAVPEPSAIALLGVGLLGLVFARHRQAA